MSTIQFINCRLCISGQLISQPLTISTATGKILPNTSISPDTKTIDLKNAIISPGYIELQTNGALGFHFSHTKSPSEYRAGVQKLAHYLPSTGVTGFHPTVPTVSAEVFKHVLPFLEPHDFTSLPSDEDVSNEESSVGGAAVLGAHVEGPFLAPSKKGAHDAANMHLPSTVSLEDVYGKENLRDSIRVVTLAPELPGALEHISTLKEEYGIAVSMGHSAASHEEGLKGLEVGASLITHTFNAMNGLNHREPGLPGLISLPTSLSKQSPPPPYFSLIADSIHLHPRIISLTYHSSPTYCILITDSIELSGLPDGLYPGHAQIPFRQLKVGNKVTIEGTDTLIGTCIGLDECVRNLMAWAGVGIEKAVMCVTENVVRVLGLEDRGKLEEGRRADFVILGEDGVVKETWVVGKRVFEKES